MKILVSGAGVAGLSLGRDLGMRGHHVVLVERADRLRSNGSPVDVRGDAIEVAEKMGILPAVRDARIRMTEQVHFVDEHGAAVGRLPDDIGDSPDDIEVAREDLSRSWPTPECVSVRGRTSSGPHRQRRDHGHRRRSRYRRTGKLADLIVVDGNPFDDPAVSRPGQSALTLP